MKDTDSVKEKTGGTGTITFIFESEPKGEKINHLVDGSLPLPDSGMQFSIPLEYKNKNDQIN